MHPKLTRATEPRPLRSDGQGQKKTPSTGAPGLPGGCRWLILVTASGFKLTDDTGYATAGLQTRQPTSTPVWPVPISSGKVFPAQRMTSLQWSNPGHRQKRRGCPTVAALSGHGNDRNLLETVGPPGAPLSQQEPPQASLLSQDPTCPYRR